MYNHIKKSFSLHTISHKITMKFDELSSAVDMHESGSNKHLSTVYGFKQDRPFEC